MTQKVLKVGSSAAVTIPKKSLEELGLRIGDRVFVYIDSTNKRVVISKNKIKNLEFLPDEAIEILRWTKRFIERYRKDFEALAKR